MSLNDAAAAYDGSLKRGSGRGKMVITVSGRQ